MNRLGRGFLGQCTRSMILIFVVPPRPLPLPPLLPLSPPSSPITPAIKIIFLAEAHVNHLALQTLRYMLLNIISFCQ